jgi:hypothetical protein
MLTEEEKVVADGLKRCKIGTNVNGWRYSPGGQCFEEKEDAISDGIARRRETAARLKELGRLLNANR